jgi:lipoprotein-releasing system ATP-binding protein
MNNPVLTLAHVVRNYTQADDVPLSVLKGANLAINPGEMVALIGPSGSGKSTLLHAAGLLEKPTSGQIIIDGLDAANMGDQERTALRRRAIGFVYQFHHLLPEFSALENIILPQMIANVSYAAAKVRALELLQAVGLEARASHRPGKLSGGEQQRVAIARALANRPKLLIADEPTGNLDPHTAEGVFDLLRDITRAEGLAALVATHNFDLAKRMDRTVTLKDGVLV